MTAPTIAELLKFAKIQMAAEALFGYSALPTSANLTPGKLYDGLIDPQVLIDGNRHSSKFSATEAADFASKWEIVEHKSNTTTGFSGTLLRALKDDPATGTKAGELVMSFRSTEFLDDAARDNQATNTLEVKEKGWAFGQIDDMEIWYKHLLDTKLIPDGTKFSVTGYSLGGHLATAFNILRREDNTMDSRIDKVVTFNGAGVGTIKQGNLSELVTYFDGLRKSATLIDAEIVDPTLRTLVGTIRTNLDNKSWTIAQAKTAIDVLKTPEHPTLSVEELMVWTALDRMQTIAKEATDAPLLNSGSTDPSVPAHPANIPLDQIEQTGFNYQMAVLLASKRTDSIGLIPGLIQTFTESRVVPNPMTNQFDVQGAPLPSAVSNSQMHYGNPVKLFIEDQPLWRGDYVSEALLRSLSYLDIKLLTNNYTVNDFGDTHSLVLLVDALAVQNTLLQMLPEGMRGAAAKTLQTALLEASNQRGFTDKSGGAAAHGQAEGDVLENTLNALADLVLGPNYAKQQRLKGSPNGGTWASPTDPTGGYTGRDKFYALLNSITDSALYKAAVAGTVTLELGTASSFASAARTDFGAFAALYSLSPFAFKMGNASAMDATLEAKWSTVYTDWKKDKATKAAGAGATDALKVSDQWLKDRAALLERKNYYNAANASYDSSQPDAYGYKDNNGVPINNQYDGENTIWEDRQSELKIQRGQIAGNTKHVVFGTDASESGITGGSNDDRLYGGAGNDTLTGGDGDDYLEGGADTDTYTFTGQFGKDLIVDSDGKGSLSLGGVALNGGKYDTTLNAWAQDINGDTYVFEVRESSASSTKKQLFIHKKDDSANTITINNFDPIKAASADGYLGIKLGGAPQLALNDQPGVNYWATHTDTSALAGQGSEEVEGAGESLAISLSAPAKAGDTLTLAMGDQGSQFEVILGNSRVPVNGAVITLKEGQTDVRFSLVQKGDITADLHASISATYKSVNPANTEVVLSNSWGITVHDSGAVAHTFTGDQRPKLIGTETQTTIPASDPTYGSYAWGETTWAADGTLNNGVVQADFNDVIIGTTEADKISGLGGNDALGGGDGNDVIDGGVGDDLIAGGKGSDTIKGGAGNDYIFSALDLVVGARSDAVGLRTRGDETWELPAGQTLWSKGSTWGISQDAQGLVHYPVYGPVLPELPDNAPDVIDAGDGNDMVIAGRGDDLIDGGAGNDQLVGAGGSASPAKTAQSSVNIWFHSSHIHAIPKRRYACDLGSRLHQGRHTQFRCKPQRTTQGAHQAPSFNPMN